MVLARTRMSYKQVVTWQKTALPKIQQPVESWHLLYGLLQVNSGSALFSQLKKANLRSEIRLSLRSDLLATDFHASLSC